MKTTTTLLLLLMTAPGLWAQTPPPAGTPTNTPAPALRRLAALGDPSALPSLAAAQPAPGMSPAPDPSTSAASAAAVAAPVKEVPGIEYNFSGVDVNQVLDIYADLIERTQLRAAGLSQATITLKTHGKLTKTEAIEALQAVLAMNNIAVINIGDKFVKEVPLEQAAAAAQNFTDSDPTNLPDVGGYVTHIVQLKYVKPSEMMPVLQPFAKLQNSLFAIDANGILVMRDLTENVQRMLQMIEKIDINVPAVYVSEVIPIRYAKVDDIASALASLGGSGSATVSIGGATASPQISGLRTSGTMGTSGLGTSGMSGLYQPGANTPGGSRIGGPAATPSPNGAPGTAQTVQQRLLNIINRASSPTSGGGGGEQPIQLFGQTKIIPNESSSSLLIYATRPDMDAITNIIAKLDVPLAQVLIEAVIVDYTLGNTLNFGVSAAQNPKIIPGSNPQVQTAGGANNGQSFYNFTTGLLGASNTSASASSAFGNSLPGGLSYFGNIGPTWEVALQAAQSDSHASIIQRPRIQTSQALPAQFFVGSSVPYITGNYEAYNGLAQNNYAQLSVGVELDVTPFINPEGAVTMQIQQEIDAIDNPDYNNTGQPSTIKRTLNTTITVRDKDTVMLGGFIEADKAHNQSGVPFLSDIPLLGNLFKKRDDQKTRKELIVLMRPTVLGTPELAAKNTLKEEQRLPGVSTTYAEDVKEQSKSVEAERKKELKHSKTMTGGFYAPMPTNAPAGQLPAPQYREDGLFLPVSPVLPPIHADTNDAVMPTP